MHAAALTLSPNAALSIDVRRIQIKLPAENVGIHKITHDLIGKWAGWRPWLLAESRTDTDRPANGRSVPDPPPAMPARPPIPTGLSPRAQGWTAARRPTLGLHHNTPQPQRGCVPSQIRPAHAPSAPAFSNTAEESSTDFQAPAAHLRPVSQRDTVYQPRATLWVLHHHTTRVL